MISAPLLSLSQAIEDLLPAAAVPLPPGDREGARLRLLRETAGALVAAPDGAGALAGGADEALRERAAALRGRAAETLGLLSAHAARELPAALSRALVHWDQAGEISLLPAAARAAAQKAQEAAQQALEDLRGLRCRAPAALGLLLAAAETMSAIDSACTLLRAVELRFVPLLRERLRRAADLSPRDALLPGGAPFLDLGAALLHVARAFGAPGPAGPGA